jgi:hypothetical protein
MLIVGAQLDLLPAQLNSVRTSKNMGRLFKQKSCSTEKHTSLGGLVSLYSS